MPEIDTFETLECYQVARRLRKELSGLCKTLPEKEERRLKDQIIRSSRSITSNIAEGYGRLHAQENLQFCSKARSSLTETLDHLNIALDEEYLPQFEYIRIRKIIENTLKNLDDHIGYIQNNTLQHNNQRYATLKSLPELYYRLRKLPLKNWCRASAFRWGTLITYMVIIAFLSLAPPPKISTYTLSIPYFDKLAHAVMHGGFAFLFCWALQYRFRHKLWLIYVVIISHIYGASMELGQYYMNFDRTFSWGDILANTVGAVIAVSLLGLYQDWRKKTSTDSTTNIEPNVAIKENKQRNKLEFSAKRVFDFCASLGGIIILLAPILIIALAVLYKHGRPIFFQQTRPGLNSEPFELLKFRTMTDQKDDNGEILPDDQRLTKLGRFLRKTSLDEFPELFNVLRGDMSLVGPRPLLMRYIPRYTAEQMRRHEVRPGITGQAQINGRNQLSWEEKFKLDVWYVNHRNFWLDIKILAITVWKVVSRQGISADEHATMPEFMGSENKNQ